MNRSDYFVCFNFVNKAIIRKALVLSASCFLFAFISCRSRSQETFEPYSGHPEDHKPAKGTPGLWQNIQRDLKSGKKPRALLLEHGEQSLLLRINLIRSARKSISIQTYSWEFDEVGKFILWELIQANQRYGVRVELLIDHMFNEHQPEMIAFLSSMDPDFKIKYFNPSARRLSPTFIQNLSDLAIDFHDHNARLHNKLLLVDDFVAVTGGRNINNHYFDQVIGMNYKDRDILLVMADPSEIKKCFDSYWNSNQSIPTSELLDVSQFMNASNSSLSLEKTYFFEYDIFSEINLDADNENIIRSLFLDPLSKVDRVEWVYDLPDKVDRAPATGSAVSRRLMELMQSTKSEIYIQSPYVVLSEEIQGTFLRLKEKENSDPVRVVISTNSLAATDNWITYAANYQEKRLYLEELNLELWEFKPIPEQISTMMNYEKLLYRLPLSRELLNYGKSDFKINKSLPILKEKTLLSPFRGRGRKNPHLKTAPYLSLHAKSFVFDQEISFVGSYNLDPRSEIYNTELGVLIYDKNFSSQLRNNIIEDISPQNSYFIANKKVKPMLSKINGVLYRISEALPFIDLWPIRPHTSFELKESMPPLPVGHEDFFLNWKDVGNFPGLSLFNKKQFSARIFKATGMIFKPLL